MSSRERNLFILLVAALVVVGTLVGIKMFNESAVALEADIDKAEAELKKIDTEIKIANSRQDFIEFLKKYEPKKERYGSDVQNELKRVCESLWRQNGLQPIKNPRVVEPEPGIHYSRRRFSLELRGEERSVISFLTQVTDPKKFRSVTRLQIKPTQGDESNTKVDATIEVDQWFIADTDVTDDVMPAAELKPAQPTRSPAAPAPRQELPPGLNLGS